MTTTGQAGPGASTGQRKNKRSKKPGRKQAPANTPVEIAPLQTVAAETVEVAAPAAIIEDIAPAPSPEATSALPSPEPASAVGIQELANAYRDYTRKSLQDAQSFAEQFSTAGSLGKAMETQSEFARKAYETFAADARKIRELHRELFWQLFRLPSRPDDKTPR